MYNNYAKMLTNMWGWGRDRAWFGMGIDWQVAPFHPPFATDMYFLKAQCIENEIISVVG